MFLGKHMIVGTIITILGLIILYIFIKYTILLIKHLKIEKNGKK